MGGCARKGSSLIQHPSGLLKGTGLPDSRDSPVSTAHLDGVWGEVYVWTGSWLGSGHRAEGEEELA